MEGMQGFFRGVVPVMVSVAALRSLSFTLYTNGKKEILDRMARDGSGAPSSQLSKIALASSCSGMVTGFIVAALNAPIEFIKLQKQLERLTLAASSTVIDEQTAPNLMKTTPNPTGTTTGSGGSTGIKFGSVGKYMAESASGRTAAAAATAAAQGGDFKAVLQGVPSRPTVGPTLQQKTFESSSTWGWTKRIVRMKGVRGLYGGAHLHLLRDGLGTAMYFGGYEVAKHMLIPVLGNGPIVHILAGGFAGTSCWLVLFPIDLTKSVIQRDYLRPNPRYRSTMEFLRSAWRKGGIRRFYSGIGPQLLRSFPVHALNFLVYEHVLKMCKELGDDEGDLQLGSSTGVPSGTPLMSSLKPQDSGPG
ncbi:hypothetical protein HK102_003895 [Quaeritorhiza haematococci]|nr:hypothetical protein HK102_003895 [Quaeritorhiza haematococci]